MDNFIFAKELELSILEHRIELILRMLDEVNIDAFYPAIIYNDSFWKLGREKKLSILQDKQSGYIGDNPINRTIFYKDNFFLEIIKSVKITYFNYTKLTLESFIQVLQTKSKFSITDFHAFSSKESRTLSLINEIQLLKENSKKLSVEKTLLSKIESLKFFSTFRNYKKTNSLIIIYEFELDYWKIFFEGLKKLDDSQNTNLIKTSNFTFLFINNSTQEKYDKEFEKLKSHTEVEMTLEYANIDEIEFREKYDYIFLDSVLSTLPTDIIIKYGHEYYNAFGRLTYVNREDPKKALENIAIIESPIKQLDKINDEILKNLDYEMTWKVLNDEEIINILETAQIVHERSLMRFSLIALRFMLKLIKAANKNALIHIWDYSENSFTKYQLGIFQDENKISRFLFDFNLNKNILELFEDINIESKIFSSSEILSAEILDNKQSFVRLDEVMDFVNMEKANLQSFFDVKNYTFYSELKSITRGLNFFKNLTEKNIMLFGLPSLLYRTGFKTFATKIKKSPNLNKLLDKNKTIENFGLNSYENEYYRNILPKISTKLEENKGILITKEKKHKSNLELLKLLEELFIDSDFFFDFINKNWEEISNFSAHKASYKLMEIRV